MEDNQAQLLREVQSQAEARLQALQQLAIAADTRAMQFGAACTAIAAVVVALSAGSTALWPMYVSATMLLAAAALSFWSGRATVWDAPGNAPKQFKTDIADNKPLSDVRKELLQHYDEAIRDNQLVLKKNGKQFNWATRLALLAPIASAGVYFAPQACRFIS